MYLSDVLEQLLHGELAQLPIGEDSNTYELLGEYEPLVSHINIGLFTLHTRFALKYDEVDIELSSNIKKYVLSPRYARSQVEFAIPGFDLSPFYILDTAEDKFVDNVVAIEEIYDVAEETSVFLNDNLQETTYLLNGPKAFDVSDPEDNKIITVKYRASIPKLEPVDLDPITTEIDLPYSLLPPLLYYIAYRVHSSYPALEGTSEADKYLARYEHACEQIENSGIITTNFRRNDRIERQGWA